EPIELWADKNTTMTILRNLVNNALKFTPEGGSVTISATEAAEFAEISVADTGVGMPADKLRTLFTLQDKKSTYGTSGEKGLGLGLQLVYEFVEMNNGKIEVRSKEGTGTTFIISLPLFDAKSVYKETDSAL
ncbi:MAG: ATP-binding protein, partial [Marinoscillum sp.]